MAALVLGVAAVILQVHWAFPLLAICFVFALSVVMLWRSPTPATPRTRLKKRRAQVAWVFGSIAIGSLVLAATAQALGYRLSADADALIAAVVFVSAVISTIAAPTMYPLNQLYRSSLEKPEFEEPPPQSESEFWADVFPDEPEDEV